MGCCLFALVLTGLPRVAFLLWWFGSPGRFAATFGPSIVMPLLGVIFLPWTALAYVFVAAGGIVGFEWVIIIFAFLLDLSSYGGGGAANRRRRA